jgi:metallo-beta-lactamase family protein
VGRLGLAASRATTPCTNAVSYAQELFRRSSTTVALASYCGPGTVGGAFQVIANVPTEQRRYLQDELSWTTKRGTLTLPASEVRAELVQLRGYSAHADREGLLDWVFWEFRGKQGLSGRTVFLTHGSAQARAGLRSAIEARSATLCAGGADAKVTVETPSDDLSWFDLDAGEWELKAADDSTDARGEIAALRRRLAELESQHTATAR